MKNVLIISYSPLHRDPRIQRQIEALKDTYSITTLGYTDSNIKNVKHLTIEEIKPRNFVNKIRAGFQIILKQYDRFLSENSNTKAIINSQIAQPDIIIANDWTGLYLAEKLIQKNKWDVKIYFDAHEYFPKYRKSIFWKLFFSPQINYVLKNCMSHVSVMSTVADGIAREYEKYFSFPINSVKVITNAPKLETDLSPREPTNKIKLIHHGGAIKERKIELMIKMMDYLDPNVYELSLMLVPTEKKYYNKLKRMAHHRKNVNFIPTVPFNDIPKFTNSFDIGLFLLFPTNFNYEHALPNKFFEFVQARLAVAIGPSIEMKDYVKKYGLGCISENFTPKSLAKEIAAMPPEDIMKCKKNCDKYANEFCAEENIKKIRSIVDNILSS